jgi:hypothetical protein
VSHPCEGHACDHCYLCDVRGICCGTVRATQAQAVAEVAEDAALRAAVAEDAAAATHDFVDELAAELTARAQSGDSPRSQRALPNGGLLELPFGPVLAVSTNTNALEVHDVPAPRKNS